MFFAQSKNPLYLRSDLTMLSIRGTITHLNDIQRIDAAPIRNSSHTSSHELSERALVLHITQRLSLLEQGSTIDLIESEVKRHTDGITNQSSAEALVAAEKSVRLDDLLDRSRHSGELSLVLRIVLRTDNLHLELRLEQIHGCLHESYRNTSDCTRQKGLRESENLTMTNSLFHLSIDDELDSVEEHVSYELLESVTTHPKEEK